MDFGERNYDAVCIECLENPDLSKISKMQKVLRDKIGSREENMRKFAEMLK